MACRSLISAAVAKARSAMPMPTLSDTGMRSSNWSTASRARNPTMCGVWTERERMGAASCGKNQRPCGVPTLGEAPRPGETPVSRSEKWRCLGQFPCQRMIICECEPSSHSNYTVAHSMAAPWKGYGLARESLDARGGAGGCPGGCKKTPARQKANGGARVTLLDGGQHVNCAEVNADRVGVPCVKSVYFCVSDRYAGHLRHFLRRCAS